MPFEKPPTDAFYLKLFAVVLLAVACGNLLSNWITVQIANHQMQVAAGESAKRLRALGEDADRRASEQQRQAQAAAEASKSQAREARQNDMLGTKLAQACAEWTKANAELKSYTTRTEQEKACKRLAEYIESGTIPQ